MVGNFGILFVGQNYNHLSNIEEYRQYFEKLRFRLVVKEDKSAYRPEIKINLLELIEKSKQERERKQRESELRTMVNSILSR